MDKRWDVLGIGVVCVDDLLYLDHFPQPNEKIHIKMKQRQGGGLTGTAIVAAARQGAKAAYCGRLGDDELSQYSLRELEHEGVDTSPTQFSAVNTPSYSVILVDMSCGSRAILSDVSSIKEPDLSVITDALISSSRVLLIDYLSHQAGLRAAEIAHAHGIPVVADLELASLKEVDLFLEQADHLVVGIEFASTFTHKQEVEHMVRELANPHRAACVVTAGANGCWYSEHGGEVHHLPAYQVNVVDTTGCGDVFHGAYAAALARGESVSRAVQVASASAALKAMCCGGREGIPNLVTVENFLKEKG
jgi:sugar/nucleoside kinase (ribokinase family)